MIPSVSAADESTSQIASPAWITIAAIVAAISLSAAAMVRPLLALALGIGTAMLIIVLLRPVWGFFAALCLHFVHPNYVPPVIDLAPFTIRIVDFLVITLLLRLLLPILVLRPRLGVPKPLMPVALFLLYIGITVFTVAVRNPEYAPSSVASYVRLLQTATLLPLTYVLFRDGRIKLLVWFLAFAGLLSTVFGLAESYYYLRPGSSIQAFRAGGLIGINALGLISGILVVLAITSHRLLPRHIPIALALVGGLGLLASRSVGSITAALATIILSFGARSLRGGLRRPVNAVAALLTLVVVTVPTIWLIRGPDVEGLLNLSGGSYAQRLYLAEAGLRMFTRNPLTGAGWQASSRPELIADPDITAALRARYALLPSSYFADEVSSPSVHNMYVQFLAELGLIGMSIFLLCAVAVYRCFERVARRTRSDLDRESARFFGLGLIFLLIWWNTNLLYGGNIETALVMVFLGGLMATRYGSRQSPDRSPIKAAMWGRSWASLLCGPARNSRGPQACQRL